MKTRTQKPSTLRAALGGAGLARTGAMLALALGAAQAGAATTYTVPLQFNITLSPPVCTLKVLTLTADAGTDAPALTSGNMVNLATMSVSKSPQDIVAAMTTTTSLLTGASAGFHTLNYGIGQRFVTTPPTATANCTAGTPMIATITRGSLASSGSAMGGSQAGNANTLPIGMYMGIASFSGNAGASGQTGVTWTTNVPTVPGVATGQDQAIVLTAALYASSTTVLSSDYAGTWIYPFNVNLAF